MNKDSKLNTDIFECKMYITDLETNQKSKEIDVSSLVFNDYIEFEFGDYEDEDYGTLPYKDFKFFINDYSVTFYSPQYHKAKQELERYKNIVDELEKAYYKMEEKQVEIDGRGYYYTDLIPIEEIINKLKKLKGE